MAESWAIWGLVAGGAAISMTGCETVNGLATLDIVAVNVTPDSVALTPGDTIRFQGTATDADGVGYAGSTLQWGTSDQSVITVSQQGLVTAIGAGAATVSAEVLGLIGSGMVSVFDPPVVVLASSALSFSAPAGGPDPSDQAVTLTNGGGGNLAGVTVSSVAYGASQPGGWLTADVASTSDGLTIRVSTAGLAIGSYDAAVGVGTFGSVDATLVVTLVIS